MNLSNYIKKYLDRNFKIYLDGSGTQIEDRMHPGFRLINIGQHISEVFGISYYHGSKISNDWYDEHVIKLLDMLKSYLYSCKIVLGFGNWVVYDVDGKLVTPKSIKEKLPEYPNYIITKYYNEMITTLAAKATVENIGKF